MPGFVFTEINRYNFLKVGIALKPNTGVDAVMKYVDEADMVLIMTVEPGSLGQWDVVEVNVLPSTNTILASI